MESDPPKKRVKFSDDYGRFITIPEDNQLGILPCPPSRKKFFDLWKRQQQRPWTNEIKVLPYLAEDRKHWKEIEKKYPALFNGLTNIILFFLLSDELARTISAERIVVYFPSIFVRIVFTAHGNMEITHNESYSHLADARFSDDPTGRKNAEQYAMSLPSINAMIEWGMKYVKDDVTIPLSERDPDYLGIMLLQFICFEGIFFTGWFAIIYAVKAKAKFPAMTSANEYIASDEADHVQNTVAAYHAISRRVSQTKVHEIFKSAVDIAKQFLYEGFPEDVPDYNIYRADVAEYIELVCNVIMGFLKYDPIYPNAKLKLSYMKNKDLNTFASFHESSDPNYRPPTSSNRYVNPFKNF
jgi:ribonucleotide reductase beta subunit family protein with ferritin-like domain